MRLPTRPLLAALALCAVFGLAACGQGRPAAGEAESPIAPLVAPEAEAGVSLTPAARATLDRLRAAAAAGNDALLVEIASANPIFQHGFGAQGTFADHLAALRAAGVDPGAQLAAVLALPPAVEQVGDVQAYVFPYLFTLDAAQFSDRVRTDAATIVGVEAAQAINAENGYAGPRAAIDAAGVWMYFISGE